MAWPDGTAEEHEVEAWLGDARQDLTAEQIQAFYARVKSEPDESVWLATLEEIQRQS
jgi:hypothetical protein